MSEFTLTFLQIFGLVSFSSIFSSLLRINMTNTSLQVLVFGIAKDIMGGAKVDLQIPLPSTVDQLKAFVLSQYPAFQDVRSLAIAVNNEYATGDDQINESDEVAIIPPVSGG